MDCTLSLANQDAVTRGCYFDEAAAERVRDFFTSSKPNH
jgi:hypothetical protein